MAPTDQAWLIDTSILVDLLRGQRPARNWINTLSPQARFISTVTAAELIAGARNRREQRSIERELALYQSVWIDEEISRLALDLYRRFHLSHRIGFLDCIVAGTALAR